MIQVFRSDAVCFKQMNRESRKRNQALPSLFSHISIIYFDELVDGQNLDMVMKWSFKIQTKSYHSSASSFIDSPVPSGLNFKNLDMVYKPLVVWPLLLIPYCSINSCQLYVPNLYQVNRFTHIKHFKRLLAFANAYKCQLSLLHVSETCRFPKMHLWSLASPGNPSSPSPLLCFYPPWLTLAGRIVSDG